MLAYVVDLSNLGLNLKLPSMCVWEAMDPVIMSICAGLSESFQFIYAISTNILSARLIVFKFLGQNLFDSWFKGFFFQI